MKTACTPVWYLRRSRGTIWYLEASYYWVGRAFRGRLRYISCLHHLGIFGMRGITTYSTNVYNHLIYAWVWYILTLFWAWYLTDTRKDHQRIKDEDGALSDESHAAWRHDILDWDALWLTGFFFFRIVFNCTRSI